MPTFPITHTNNLDVTQHNGGTRGLFLGGVLVTKTAAEINAGLALANPAAAIADITNTATGAEIATAVNGILAALRAAGIILP